MNLQVTVDKNDTVLWVERPAGESRWRFKRKKPMDTASNRRKLTEIQEQEICAAYTDSPNLTVRQIGELFDITPGGVQNVIEAYDLPRRNPGRRGRPRKSVPQPPSDPHTVERRQSKTELQDEVNHLRIEAAMQRAGEATVQQLVKDQAEVIHGLRYEITALNLQVQERDNRAETKEMRMLLILERLSSVINSSVDSLDDLMELDNKTRGDLLVELGKMRGLLEWAIAEAER